jgi:hypothetical protein
MKLSTKGISMVAAVVMAQTANSHQKVKCGMQSCDLKAETYLVPRYAS